MFQLAEASKGKISNELIFRCLGLTYLFLRFNEIFKCSVTNAYLLGILCPQEMPGNENASVV